MTSAPSFVINTNPLCTASPAPVVCRYRLPLICSRPRGFAGHGVAVKSARICRLPYCARFTATPSSAAKEEICKSALNTTKSALAAYLTTFMTYLMGTFESDLIARPRRCGRSREESEQRSADVWFNTMNHFQIECEKYFALEKHPLKAVYQKHICQSNFVIRLIV